MIKIRMKYDKKITIKYDKNICFAKLIKILCLFFLVHLLGFLFYKAIFVDVNYEKIKILMFAFCFSLFSNYHPIQLSTHKFIKAIHKTKLTATPDAPKTNKKMYHCSD